MTESFEQFCLMAGITSLTQLMNEKALTPAARREAVAHFQDGQATTESQACGWETERQSPVRALPNQRWSLDFVHDQMARV